MHTKYLLALFALGTANGFSFDGLRQGLGFQQPLGNDEMLHYSQLKPEEIPIHLEQYMDEVVVRADYSKNPSFKQALLLLKSETAPEQQQLHYKLWGNSDTKKYIDMQMSSSEVGQLMMLFPDVKFDVIIEDLPQAVFESYPRITTQENEGANKFTQQAMKIEEEMKINSDIFFREYRPLETIYSWLDILQQTFPDMVTLEWIGQTYEGRDYKVAHISTPNGMNPEKKTIVITGGIHSREWVSISSTCYILYNLLSRYGIYKKETQFLNELDFLFIPVANPDGYEYTWTHDRLWRKNRQETYLPRCFGIDIDHSFDFQFQHSDDFPCGEDYSGEEAFEAIEADIWNNYLNVTKAELQIYGYIDLHSYAQEILYPYAYSCDQFPRDSENLIELAYGLSKAIRLKSGKHYDVLPACKDRDSDLMPSLGSGTALDFMYHNRAYWAFQIKLRDSGSHGFLLPSKYIVPVGKEIYSSIRYFCSFILNPE